MTTVAVICSGNICRSFMAEKVFTRHIPRVRFISAGVMPWQLGAGPDPQAAATLAESGYATDHVCRALSDEVLSASRILVCQRDYVNLFLNVGCSRSAVRMVTEYDPAAPGEDVANPWGQSERVFRAVLGLFERVAPELRRDVLPYG